MCGLCGSVGALTPHVIVFEHTQSRYIVVHVLALYTKEGPLCGHLGRMGGGPA